MQATEDTLICVFCKTVLLPWQQVCSLHIVDAVKDAVRALKLTKKKGFDFNKI